MVKQTETWVSKECLSDFRASALAGVEGGTHSITHPRDGRSTHGSPVKGKDGIALRTDNPPSLFDRLTEIDSTMVLFNWESYRRGQR